MAISKDTVEAVLDELSDGIPLGEALKKRGLKRSSFRKAVLRDFNTMQNYYHARADFADALSEEIIGIADKEPDSIKARNMIDVRRWIASKYHPKVYGDRIDVNVVEKVDLQSVIEAARERSMLPLCDPLTGGNPQTIDVLSVVSSVTTGSEPVAPDQVAHDPADDASLTDTTEGTPDADVLLS